MTTTTKPFLSDEQLAVVDENSASDSRYVKFSAQKNNQEYRYRFFGTAITGFSCWVTEDGNDKPLRWEMKPEELPATIKPDQSGKKEAKFFLAGIVWDYTDERFKIMEVTQKTILDKIKKFCQDEEYGDTCGYDLKITKKEEQKRTSYDVVPSPPKPPARAIAADYKELVVDLEALFDGTDPFADPTA